MSRNLIMPRSVSIDAEAIIIEWQDGMVCRYPHRYLRLQCGCAGCIEEMTGRRILDVSAVPQDVFAADHMEVGRYALQFMWTDGHATGIYPYERLRELCADQAVEVGRG